MAVPVPSTGQHIFSLVIQSKKALQEGDVLCSSAHERSNATADMAIDVLEVDARVRWLTDAVLEQLKLAADVARSIDEKRAELEVQVQEYDAQKARHTSALDAILDALGAQSVPPDFYTDPDFEEDGVFASPDDEPGGSPDTLRAGSRLSTGTLTDRYSERERETQDRKRWKTLRDFVDERAIEDVLEYMESERSAMERALNGIANYSETIDASIEAVRSALPLPSCTPSPIINGHASPFSPGSPTPVGTGAHQTPQPEASPLPDTTPVQVGLRTVTAVVAAQEEISTRMAQHLESLAHHYDTMATALGDCEAGAVFEEEDFQEMDRDAGELGPIVAELERNDAQIEAGYEQMKSFLVVAQEQLEGHHGTLDDLDELEGMMEEMVQRVQHVEIETSTNLNSLQAELTTLDDLHARFAAYQVAYNRLLLELGRRRQYRDAAERIVQGMVSQLRDMVEEEHAARQAFNASQGAHLPTDLCLCVQSPPTRWDVIPASTESEMSGALREVLPEVGEELLAEARERIAAAQNGEGGVYDSL